MNGFWQLVSANIKDIVRDRMSIFWFLAFPLLFILLFGAIFGSEQNTTKYSIGLVIKDEGMLGSNIKRTFQSIHSFELHQGSEAKELKALKTGQRILVVIVPKIEGSAAMGVGSTKPIPIPIYYDPGKASTAQILISSVKDVLSGVERAITGAPRLIIAEPRKAEVAKHKNIDYFLPGILAMALMQLGLFGALNFVSLRERKIIRRLGATPLPRSMILWSEIVVRLMMAIIQTIVIIIIGYIAFGVTITGNILIVASTVIIGAGVFISLGYFLVNFTKTEESAQGLIQVVQFPMMFLSGIFIPIEIMPSFLKPVVNLLPLTYLGDLLRNVMVGLPSAFSVWTDLGILSGWFVITLVLAIRWFKWD